jgi:hypothetical protein
VPVHPDLFLFFFSNRRPTTTTTKSPLILRTQPNPTPSLAKSLPRSTLCTSPPVVLFSAPLFVFPPSSSFPFFLSQRKLAFTIHELLFPERESSLEVPAAACNFCGILVWVIRCSRPATCLLVCSSSIPTNFFQFSTIVCRRIRVTTQSTENSYFNIASLVARAHKLFLCHAPRASSSWLVKALHTF